MAVPPPPPPPEDPFQNGDSPDPFGNLNGPEESMQPSTPTVAAKPGRVLLVLGFVAALIIFILYLIFHSRDKGTERPKPVVTTAAEQAPPASVVQPLTSIPPPPAITPPSIPTPTKVSILKPEEDEAAQKARIARLHSGIVIASQNGGSLGGSLLGSENDLSTPSNDPNSAFAASVAKANTKADRVQATRIGDLRRTIAQGRLIPATTESAINTELPAPIRAIVSRDVYGEAGKVPLIPKGSRLIGSYNTAIGSGQSRVFVVWTRVIRPDGVDVMINSPLVDQIGQAGVGGQVDNKFQEIFSHSVLASVVGIAFAIGEDKIQGGSTTTTNSSTGSTTTGDAASLATVNALNRLGSTTDSFIQKLVGIQPSILVDQGTPVNVFVNRDLVFPAEYVGEGRVIE